MLVGEINAIQIIQLLQQMTFKFEIILQEMFSDE